MKVANAPGTTGSTSDLHPRQDGVGGAVKEVPGTGELAHVAATISTNSHQRQFVASGATSPADVIRHAANVQAQHLQESE